jgi:hypothetical protein
MAERTFTFSVETISIENLDDGSHVVKVGRDGTKILAYIVDGKLARYAAEDAAGNRKALLNITQESADSVQPILPGEAAGFECQVCYFDEVAGAVVCHGVVECPPVPPPDELKGP